MNLSYELAKKLKDAGFPQREGEQYIRPNGEVVSGQYQGNDQHLACKLPTLSELIEACGREGLKLIHAQAGWCAQWGPVMLVNYSTPLEAVANLWLALNIHE